MSKMNPDIKAKWVAALRSGEYAQGRGRLNNNGAMCCLGVLCDLHAQETGGSWERAGVYMRAFSFAPDAVVEWAGLPSCNPGLFLNGAPSTVADLNDGLSDQGIAPLPFAEIANAIEAQL